MCGTLAPGEILLPYLLGGPLVVAANRTLHVSDGAARPTIARIDTVRTSSCPHRPAIFCLDAAKPRTACSGKSPVHTTLQPAAAESRAGRFGSEAISRSSSQTPPWVAQCCSKAVRLLSVFAAEAAEITSASR
jgi:hypothetical protein